MPSYIQVLKQRFRGWRKRRKKANKLLLHQLDMFLYYQVHRFSKENRERRKKKRLEQKRKNAHFFKTLFRTQVKKYSKESRERRKRRRIERNRKLAHFFKTFLRFQAKKYSKEGRQLSKKKRQANYRKFLLNLDNILFNIIGYYSKDARNGRYRRRKERRDIALIKIKYFIKSIIFYYSAEIRQKRKERRKKAFNFFMTKLRFFLQHYIVKVYWLIVDLKSWLKDKENRRNFWINTVNSTAAFVLAYMVMFVIYQIVTMLMALMYNIPSKMLYFKTDFLVHSSSNLWSRNIVILVSAIGPIVSLSLGFVLYRLFLLLKKKKGLFKLFILWCSVHGVNMFFGAYVGGIFSNKGFGLVMLWFFLQFFLNVAFGFISIILLIFIGSLFSKAFLQTAHNSNQLTKANKPYFVFSQALLPYILGNIIIDLAFELPGNLNYNKLYQMVTIACIGFMIFPMITKPYEGDVRLAREPDRIKINPILILLFIIIAIAFRLGLEQGLKIS